MAGGAVPLDLLMPFDHITGRDQTLDRILSHQGMRKHDRDNHRQQCNQGIQASAHRYRRFRLIKMHSNDVNDRCDDQEEEQR